MDQQTSNPIKNNFKTSIILIVIGIVLVLISGAFIPAGAGDEGWYTGMGGVPALLIGIGLILGGLTHWFVVPLLDKIRKSIGK